MMRARFIKFISAFLALTLLVSCSGGSKSVGKLNFQHESQDKEVGITESIYNYTDNYAVGVNYPVIGKDTVDKQIKAVAEGFVKSFESDVRDYKAKNKNDRAVLSADYKAYLASENQKVKDKAAVTVADDKVYSYASIVFEVVVDIPGKSIHKQTMKTCLYNLKTGKPVALEDIFKGNYNDLISKKVISYFTGNRLFSADTNTELFKKNTLPAAGNFLNFAIVDQSVVFYFDQFRLLPEKYGCPSAVIPISELKSLLKVKITGIPAAPLTDSEKLKAEHVDHPKVNGKAKLIALTFDDGPSNSATNMILDTLKEYGGRVTFFVVGTRVSSYAKTLKRAYSLGCEIANHSYSHKKLSKIKDKQELNYQITQTNKLVSRIIPEKPVLFRVPYGENDEKLRKQIPMPLIGWCIDSNDWKYNDMPGIHHPGAQRNKAKQKLIDGVLNKVKDGDIVIMHDIYGLTAEACQVIIPELKKKGFTLVTVSEMMEARGKTLKNGEIYYCAKK